MTDKKLKKEQDKAQAAVLDLFNTLTRFGIWRCHLVMGVKLTGEFEDLTVVGMQMAAMESNLDDIQMTLAPKPPTKTIAIESTPGMTTEKEVDAEEPVGD